MKDFSLKKYALLLQTLKNKGYAFYTFEQACEKMPEGKSVILRHDVDLKAENSLATALIEKGLSINASYYFRVVPQSDKPEIIKKIAEAGHEIGYHYEDMTIAAGNYVEAYGHFKKYLAYFRTYYPVKTICMHGSPKSAYDGKDLWKHYNYRDLGIIGEPYFDMDFSKFFYLTDTGRRWDGYKVSVRDKVEGYSDLWAEQGLTYHSTDDIIAAAENGTLPERFMMVTHPQRWTDNAVEWCKELIMQNLKNAVKFFIVRRQK